MEFEFHRCGELQLIGGETGEATGVNATEERADRAERREELLIDWMEGEIRISKGRGNAVLIAGEETEGRGRRRKKKGGKEEDGRRLEWAGLRAGKKKKERKKERKGRKEAADGPDRARRKKEK